MKPRHLSWLVTSAVLSAGLSAFAQQTPPAGSQSQPSQENPEAAPVDRDTRDIRATDPATATPETPSANPSASTPAEDRTATTDDMSRPYDRDGSAEEPKKKKRSFWDRITGRNKHLDADNTAPETQQPETRPQP